MTKANSLANDTRGLASPCLSGLRIRNILLHNHYRPSVSERPLRTLSLSTRSLRNIQIHYRSSILRAVSVDLRNNRQHPSLVDRVHRRPNANLINTNRILNRLLRDSKRIHRLPTRTIIKSNSLPSTYDGLSHNINRVLSKSARPTDSRPKRGSDYRRDSHYHDRWYSSSNHSGNLLHIRLRRQEILANRFRIMRRRPQHSRRGHNG